MAELVLFGRSPALFVSVLVLLCLRSSDLEPEWFERLRLCVGDRDATSSREVYRPSFTRWAAFQRSAEISFF